MVTFTFRMHPETCGCCPTDLTSIREFSVGAPALYAGDLTIQRGAIVDLTNLSGTFQCDDPDGLLAVAAELTKQGARIAPSAVRFFPMDGSRPVVLK